VVVLPGHVAGTTERGVAGHEDDAGKEGGGGVCVEEG
jgi:hypothetical protein